MKKFNMLEPFSAGMKIKKAKIKIKNPGKLKIKASGLVPLASLLRSK